MQGNPQQQTAALLFLGQLFVNLGDELAVVQVQFAKGI
jgi:hypothetical protein